MKRRFIFQPALLALAVLVCTGSSVYAASTPDFTQVVNTGTLVTDILDASRVTVASPAVAMTAKSFSFNCYASGTASTGSLGTSSQRLYVTNPNGANNGWTLTLGATAGATATWANTGATNKFDFNDPTGTTAGCTDGADADSVGGQLTVNPSAGSLTADCGSCANTGITLGSSTAFNQGTTDSVTLVNAAASSNDVWRGYFTGATASQTLPAETPADSYTINLTLTATAQ